MCIRDSTENCECAGTFTDADADGVCDAEDICEFGDDNLDTDGDGTPDACDFDDTSDNCPAFDFNEYPVVSYGNNQDNGTSTTSADGTTVELNDNAWKAIELDYEVTPFTVIEFDFKSTQEGEIHAVGFDNNTTISGNLTFELYGTQSWGIQDFNVYSGSGEYEHFVIPVGEFYTGQASYFFFVMDHDLSLIHI